MLRAEKRQVKYLDGLTIGGWDGMRHQKSAEAIASCTQWRHSRRISGHVQVMQISIAMGTIDHCI